MQELTIRTTVDVHATASEAWSLLGEGFGDWANWAPGIEQSTLQGPLQAGVLRVNKAPSLGTVTQELVVYEPAKRELAYEMREGLPPFLEKLRNDWVVEEVEGKARLRGVAVFGLRDAAAPKRPEIEAKMSAVLDGFAAAFKTALES